MEDKQPGYYMVIPATVWNDKRLTSNAKLLYGHISTLTHKTGECFATNDYFVKVMEIKERSIQRLLDDLLECNHICRSLITEDNISKRIITLPQSESPGEDVRVTRPHDISVTHNKTSINKTRERSRKTIDPFLEQAVIEGELDARSRWNKITSLWVTNEAEATLAATFKNHFLPLGKEIQMSIVEMVEGFSSDVEYLEKVWISTAFKNKCMNTQSLQKDIDKAKRFSKPKSKTDDIRRISNF
jgi:hypothetical protein